jgi:hypothetical protein
MHPTVQHGATRIRICPERGVQQSQECVQAKQEWATTRALLAETLTALNLSVGGSRAATEEQTTTYQ